MSMNGTKAAAGVRPAAGASDLQTNFVAGECDPVPERCVCVLPSILARVVVEALLCLRVGPPRTSLEHYRSVPRAPDMHKNA